MLKVTEPTFLLDDYRCRKNIERMAAKAKRNGCAFRPHFKTHQSLAVGDWFSSEGVDCITVSSVKMADYFSAAWRDITIAMPFNALEIDRLNGIDLRARLGLCVMYPETVEFLDEHLTRSVDIWIKIDVGYHRTGLAEDDPNIDAVLRQLVPSEKMEFKGFLAHAGHTYHASGADDIAAINAAAQSVMSRLKKRYVSMYPNLRVSLGDTPACSIVEDHSGCDELRPGNFVFYDIQQYGLGACELEDIAVAMVCPIVAKHSDRLVIHGGGVHFSKDAARIEDGSVHFGLVVNARSNYPGDGWSSDLNGLKLTSLSQEHGTITGPSDALEKYTPGDLVFVLPAHSCMTASSMKAYTTLDGKRLPHLEGVYDIGLKS